MKSPLMSNSKKHDFRNKYFFSNLTLILLRCIQQPCGYDVTGQLQEPKDLTRLATVKVVYTILYSSEASLLLYYKRSYSFNPHIRFPAHLAE